MVQLKSFARTLMVVLTAPLGMIGVTAGLLASGFPFGFVAMLGTIALSGIIMRNSVILVDQIEQDLKAGHAPWDAVIESARGSEMYKVDGGFVLADAFEYTPEWGVQQTFGDDVDQEEADDAQDQKFLG